MVSAGVANGISSMNGVRDKDLESLIARKKLRLVVDLNNTLVHTQLLQNLYRLDQHYLKDRNPCYKQREKLYKGTEHITKVRPYARTFIEEASKLFDISILTLGSRDYAKEMLDILDPKRQFLDDSRVITWEDYAMNSKKKGSLDDLVSMSSHKRVTLVVDNKQDFWMDSPKNLIKVEPYMFFDDKNATKMTWSRWQGDESINHGDLARALRQLNKIHAEFYKQQDEDCDCYESRDVREAVDELKRQFMFYGTNAYDDTLRKRPDYQGVSPYLCDHHHASLIRSATI